MSSDLEAAFDTWLKRLAPKVPAPAHEYRFTTMRKWRFDRAWIDQRVAVELEGAVYTNGRHTRGKGYEADCEKYNTAVAHTWRVFRFTAGMLERDPLLCISQVVIALGYDPLEVLPK